jgi:hypothetical protein
VADDEGATEGATSDEEADGEGATE